MNSTCYVGRNYSHASSSFGYYRPEEVLDNAIKDLTKGPLKVVEEKDADFVNLYKHSPQVIKEKLERKLQIVDELKIANPAVKLSKGQVAFIRECKECLRNAIKTVSEDKKDLFKGVRLTLSGDLFLGENDGDNADGYGVLLTNKNELIEGKFSKGVIQKGKIRVLYANGEYYVGEAKQGGIRNGDGVHYYANGDIYDGEFLDNQRVGKSRLRFNDGSEYIGQFIDDTADGHGIFMDKEGNRYMTMVDEQEKHKEKDGKESDSGYFLKGKIYGRGEIKFKNGDTYVGFLRGTRRHGKGHMSFIVARRNGDRFDIGEYEGNWNRDKREGVGKMQYANGSTFTGIWKNDKRYKGELTEGNNQSYKGKFHNNMYHGPGELTLSNGTVLKGEFDHGFLTNPATIEFSDGRIFTGEVIENDIGRKGKLQYANGDVYEGLFEDRQRCGVGVLITQDGSKYEGRWQDNKKDGYGKEYNSLANEYYEGQYAADKRDGHGKLINRKGEVYIGEWKTNKKVLPMPVHEKMDKEQYQKLVKNFMKSKANSEPIVRILA